MTRARNVNQTAPADDERRPGVVYHPRSPSASLEELDRLAGIITLTGPVPSWKFMDDEDGCDEDEKDRAGH